METAAIAGYSDALALIESWEVPHAAAAVVTEGESVSHGDDGMVFAWASVTKLLVATAMLVAVEEGTVRLDEPAGPEGSTVRHLLSHASGLPGPPARGRAHGGAPGQPPSASSRPADRPGTRRVYSNQGFEVLANLLGDRSGLDFSTYLAEAVLQPLGMKTVRVTGSSAWGASGSLSDLVTFAHELLRPRLVSSETMALATEVAFPHLAGVLPGYGMMRPNDWGLGFEIRSTKHPHWTGALNSVRTFGHFGQSGSFLWVDPDAGIACTSLSDRQFGPWAQRAWPALSDAVLSVGRAP